jgi:aryl-alcohol dehydrogenase-like predicted oxidoreductase
VEATSPGAVAVAWTLRHRAVDGAIVGFRRPDQVDDILAAAGLDLGYEEARDLEGNLEGDPEGNLEGNECDLEETR